MSDVFYAGMIPFYLDGGCTTWTEDFDDLSEWTTNGNMRTVVVSNAGAATIPFSLDDGAGVVACATLSSPSVGMGEAVRITATPASTGQWIEITIADFFQLAGDADNFRSEIQIFNFGGNPALGAPGGNFGYIRWESDVERLTLQAYSTDSGGFFTGDDPGPITYEPWTGGTDLVLRLKTWNNGETELMLDDAVVAQFIAYAESAAPGPGFYQGITMWWDVQFNACAATSPRITFAQGGELCEAPPS